IDPIEDELAAIQAQFDFGIGTKKIWSEAIGAFIAAQCLCAHSYGHDVGRHWYSVSQSHGGNVIGDGRLRDWRVGIAQKNDRQFLRGIIVSRRCESRAEAVGAYCK